MAGFTRPTVKYQADKKPFKKSVRTLRRQLPKELKKSLRRAGVKIAKNTKARFKANYGGVSDREAKAVLNNIRASEVFETATSLFIGIGNIEKLDRATEVIAKSTGKRYQLWKLLEEGYGQKGGFRSGPYDIFPVLPSSSAGQSIYRNFGGTRRGGVFHTNPNRKVRPTLVFRVNGNLVFASRVRHPGAEGRFFFMSATNEWYREDLGIARRQVKIDLDNLLESVNYRGK